MLSEIFVLECDQLVPISDYQSVHVVVVFPCIVGHASKLICRPLGVKVIVIRHPAEKAMPRVKAAEERTSEDEPSRSE